MVFDSMTTGVKSSVGLATARVPEVVEGLGNRDPPRFANLFARFGEASRPPGWSGPPPPWISSRRFQVVSLGAFFYVESISVVQGRGGASRDVLLSFPDSHRLVRRMINGPDR